MEGKRDGEFLVAFEKETINVDGTEDIGAFVQKCKRGGGGGCVGWEI